jgi:hypothetical protein
MGFTPGYSDFIYNVCCERLPLVRFHQKNARISGTGNYSTLTGLESMQNWRSQAVTIFGKLMFQGLFIDQPNPDTPEPKQKSFSRKDAKSAKKTMSQMLFCGLNPNSIAFLCERSTELTPKSWRLCAKISCPFLTRI